MPWRETITDFSANIFTDLPTVVSPNDYGTYLPSPSTPLQMFLFYNVYFFPFWLVTISTFLSIKFHCLGHLTKFLTSAVMIMTAVIECVRLYLGYIGNLSERIPELAGFWMLSILLQLPLQTFLLSNPYLQPRPIELIMNGIMWLLLVAELFTGFFALRTAAARAKQYYALKSHLKKCSENAKTENKLKSE